MKTQTTPAAHRARQRSARRGLSLPHQVGILLVLGLVVVGIWSLKPAPAPETAVAELPELQLNHALAEQRPAVVFFHSLSCESCLEMTEIVGQVLPEYATTVALIDVDVYDERNTALMRRERLQAIPTVVFYDPSGARQVAIGVMSPEELRQVLDRLIGRIS